MKDLVIIIGTIVLGCLIFNMIAGDQDSLKKCRCGRHGKDNRTV